jgi:hypothetical protein
MWQNVHVVQNKLTFASVYVIKYQPYNAISPGFCLEVKNTACGKSLFPYSEDNREISILRLWVQKNMYIPRYILIRFVISFMCISYILRTLIDCTFFDRRQAQRVVWRELICRDATVFYITWNNWDGEFRFFTALCFGIRI